MKIVGFYIVDRSAVSPTVFRSIVCDKLRKLGFDLKDVIKPGIMERSDIINIKDNSKSVERAKEFLNNKVGGVEVNL